MAIGRVPGSALLPDLDRQGVDLSFTTSSTTLLDLDFTNFRVGINTAVPAAALDVVGNVVITGNLTVSGAQTTISTTNTLINDPFVLLNNGATGTNLNDLGFLFNRGSGTGVALVWDESVDEFITAFTPNTSILAGNLSISSYANARVGNLVANSISTSGNVNISIATASTTYTSGALRVTGGIGASGNLNVAGNLNAGGDSFIGGNLIINSTTQANNTTTGALVVYGGAIIQKDLRILGNLLADNLVSTTINYVEFNDPLVFFNSGNVLLPYDFSIGFYSNYRRTVPDTATVFTGLIRDASDNIWKFVSNLSEPSGNVTTFNSFTNYDAVRAGSLALVNTAISTSTTTGALTVAGGVGINSNLWVANGAVINSTQSAQSFTVRGQTSTALIHTDSSKGGVVIGGAGSGGSGGNTAIPGGVRLKVDGTDSMMLPVGTTVQRPGASGNVDQTGMLRFNSTLSTLEFYDGSAWEAAGAVLTIISDRQFSGNGGGFGDVNGVNSNFTLQSTATTASTLVAVDGLVYRPVSQYTVSGTTLTFTTPPTTGSIIDARILTATTIVDYLANADGRNRVLTTNSGVELYSGTASSVLRANITQEGLVSYENGTRFTYNQENFPVVNSPFIIDSFPAATYRSAKYIIQVSSPGAGEYEAREALVTHNGSIAYITSYAINHTGAAPMGNISVGITSGSVELIYHASVATANIKVMSTYIGI